MLAPFALFSLFSSVILIYFWFPSAISDHLCFLILSPFHPHSNTRTPNTHQPVSDSVLVSSSFPSTSTFYITPQFSTTSRLRVTPLLPTHLIYQPLSFPLSPLLFSPEYFIQLTIASNSFLITSADDFACSQLTLAFFCFLCLCAYSCIFLFQLLHPQLLFYCLNRNHGNNLYIPLPCFYKHSLKCSIFDLLKPGFYFYKFLPSIKSSF